MLLGCIVCIPYYWFGAKAKISLLLKKANICFHGSPSVAGSLPWMLTLLLVSLNKVNTEYWLVLFYLLSFIYSVCLITFTVHFTILLTNVFWSLFEIPEVCHELGNFITQWSVKLQNLNQSCKFHCELCWEVALVRGELTL